MAARNRRGTDVANDAARVKRRRERNWRHGDIPYVGTAHLFFPHSTFGKEKGVVVPISPPRDNDDKKRSSEVVKNRFLPI